jgi:ribonucleoside-diphosphate reductase alpha chain
MFRSKFSEDIFNLKYSHPGCDTWQQLASVLVKDVCGNLRDGEENLMSVSEQHQLTEYIKDLKFVPGGRYLYYAGRKNRFYNNCFLLKAEEDTREDWANLSWKSESCLMTGGGIGVDYSVYRESGRTLTGTGGVQVVLRAVLSLRCR